MEATLVYPHQLFYPFSGLSKDRLVILVEDPLFFSQYSFHKQKLVFHRATMKAHAKLLEQQGYDTTYIDASELERSGDISTILEAKDIDAVFVAEFDDDWLERRVGKALRDSDISISIETSPGFLTPLSWSKKFFSENNYHQTAFYIAQRKRLDVMIKNGKPAGGSWTFDSDNRKKLPKDHRIPERYIPQTSSDVREAMEYVEVHFSDNPGSLDEWIYPTTRYTAEKWLEDFLEVRLLKFGDYQDAITGSEDFLYHSLLSPLINVGLLTPQKVIDATLKYASDNDVPINSLEGFVRQVIGWREYFRALYALESRKQRCKNFWKFDRKIPKAFWSAETNIPPVDDAIKKINRCAYAHHIERLMVLGNFMLLCEFDPDEVYRWFMELFIDSYDWVMVPNVYGMSQYADGGMTTTKPYISSSNYIRKMSDYGTGEWCEVWDGLYWSFIDKRRDVFGANPRMKFMISHLKKMDDGKRKRHREVADSFIGGLS